MSRLTKALLGVGFFLVLSGGLLALTGGIMGGEKTLTITRGGHTINVSPLGLHGYFSDDSSEGGRAAAGESGGGLQELDAFDAVEIEASAADVTLVRSDLYGVELSWTDENYQLSYELADGRLHVWSTPEREHNASEAGCAITLYVPRDATLKWIDADVDLGDIDLDGVSLTGDLTIHSGLGDVSASGGIGGDAEMDTGMGNVTLLGSPQGDTSLSTGMGDIVMEADLPRSAYRLDLKSGMGAITVDGREEKDPVESGSGSHSLEMDSGMGSLDVTFAAE